MNLSETVTDFVLKTVKFVLKHGEEVSETLELFCVEIVTTTSGRLTILHHLNELVELLFEDLDTRHEVTEVSLDVLFQFGFVSLDFEADALK